MSGKGMKACQVEVVNVPPTYMIALGLAQVERVTKAIYGTTLADAMRRAGIQ